MLKKNYNKKNILKINFILYFFINYKDKKQYISTFINNYIKTKIINKLNIIDILKKCCLYQLNFRCNEIINQSEFNYNEFVPIDLSIFGTSIRGLSNTVRFYRIRGEREILEKDIDIVDMCRLPPILVIYIYYSFVNYEYFKLFNEDNPFISVYTDLKVEFKKKKKISMFIPPKIKPLRSAKRDTYLDEYTKLIKRQLNKEKIKKKNFLASKNEYEIEYESEDEVKETHKIELRKVENLKKATQDLIVFERGKFIEKKIRKDKHILTETELINKYSLIGDGSKKYWFQCLGILEAYDNRLYNEKAKLYKYRKMPKKIKKSLNVNLVPNYTDFLLTQKIGVGLLENLTNIELKEINKKIEKANFEVAVDIGDNSYEIESQNNNTIIEDNSSEIELKYNNIITNDNFSEIEPQYNDIITDNNSSEIELQYNGIITDDNSSEIELQYNGIITDDNSSKTELQYNGIITDDNSSKIELQYNSIITDDNSTKIEPQYNTTITDNNSSEIVPYYNSTIILQKYNLNILNETTLIVSKKLINSYSTIPKKKKLIINYKNILLLQKNSISYFKKVIIFNIKKDKIISNESDNQIKTQLNINYENIIKSQIYDFSIFEKLEQKITINKLLNENIDNLTENYSILEKTEPVILKRENDFLQNNNNRLNKILLTLEEINSIDFTQLKKKLPLNNKLDNNKLDNIKSTFKEITPFTLEKLKDNISDSYKSELDLEGFNLNTLKKFKKTKKELLKNSNEYLTDNTNNILEIQSILEKIDLLKLKDLIKINKLLIDNNNNNNLIKVQSILKKINVNILKDVNNANHLYKVQTILEKILFNNLKRQQNILNTKDLTKTQTVIKDINLVKQKTIKKKKLKNDVNNIKKIQPTVNDINLTNLQESIQKIELIDKSNISLIETQSFWEDNDSEDEFSYNKFLKTFKNQKTEKRDKNEILNDPTMFDNYNNFLESLSDCEKKQIEKNKLSKKNINNLVEIQQYPKELIIDNCTDNLTAVQSKLEKSNFELTTLNFKDFFIDYDNYLDNFDNIFNNNTKTQYITEKIKLIKLKKKTSSLGDNIKNSVVVRSIIKKINLIKTKNLKKNILLGYNNDILKDIQAPNEETTLIDSKKLKKKKNIKEKKQLLENSNDDLINLEITSEKLNLTNFKNIKKKTSSLINNINPITNVQPTIQEIELFRPKTLKEKKELENDNISLTELRSIFNEINLVELQDIKKIRYRVPKKKINKLLIDDTNLANMQLTSEEINNESIQEINSENKIIENYNNNLIGIQPSLDNNNNFENIDNQKKLININTDKKSIHINSEKQEVSHTIIRKKISTSSRGYNYAKEVFARLGLNFKNTTRIFNEMLSKVDNISELSCFFFEKYSLTGLDFFFDDICGSNDEEHCAALFGIHLGYSKDEILVKKHEQDIASSLEIYVDDFKNHDDEKDEENFITTFFFSNVESERLFLVENKKNLEGFHVL